MFKRIASTYNTASVAELNEINLTPLQEELDNPDKTIEQITSEKQAMNAFKGQYQCQLCPHKVIGTEIDLNQHLKSK